MKKLPVEVKKILRRHPSLESEVHRLSNVTLPKAGPPVDAEQETLIPRSDKEGRKPKRK